jgi:SAM-dependent methyltransferase
MTATRRDLALAVVALAAAVGAACQSSAPDSAEGLRFPAPDRPVAPIISSAYSDEETRDRNGEAERVMRRLGVTPGLRVADIGAGDGYYTLRLARRLGPGGVVYAQDVEPKYLKGLEERLAREGVPGVTLILGAPRDPRLPPASIDLALLSHMYHEIENPYEFLYRLHPALRPGARIGIIDNDRPTQGHGTPPALLRCELAALGYRQVDFLDLAPAEGYLAVFEPPAQLPPVSSITACRQ